MDNYNLPIFVYSLLRLWHADERARRRHTRVTARAFFYREAEACFGGNVQPAGWHRSESFWTAWSSWQSGGTWGRSHTGWAVRR